MKELKKIIKNLDGNVLGIGLSSDLIEEIENNDKIVNCNLLNPYIKSKKKFSLFNKTIKIKKIRKVFKKKKVDYIICNYDEINNYFNTFVKDSIYINKKKIYYFGNVDISLLKYKYGRYNTNIIIKNKNLIEIDNSKAKNNFFKDNYYRLKDFKDRLVELIGDILMN